MAEGPENPFNQSTIIIHSPPFLPNDQQRVRNCPLCDEDDTTKMIICISCNFIFHPTCVKLGSGANTLTWICRQCKKASSANLGKKHKSSTSLNSVSITNMKPKPAGVDEPPKKLGQNGSKEGAAQNGDASVQPTSHQSNRRTESIVENKGDHKSCSSKSSKSKLRLLELELLAQEEAKKREELRKEIEQKAEALQREKELHK